MVIFFTISFNIMYMALDFQKTIMTKCSYTNKKYIYNTCVHVMLKSNNEHLENAHRESKQHYSKSKYPSLPLFRQ